MADNNKTIDLIAAWIHEIYSALRKAGFSKSDALTLTSEKMDEFQWQGDI